MQLQNKFAYRDCPIFTTGLTSKGFLFTYISPQIASNPSITQIISFSQQETFESSLL